MNLIGYLRNGRIVDVQTDAPLPVEVQNPPEPVAIDTLLIGEAFATTTARDLLGNTDAQTPTLTQTAPY